MKINRVKIISACEKLGVFSLYCLVFFIPISKGAISTFIYLAIAAFLVKKIAERSDIRSTPLNIALFVYLLVCFISVFTSSNLRISLQNFLGKPMTAVALFFAVDEFLSSERRVKNLLYILFSSAFILGVDGIYQNFTHKEFIRHRHYYDIPRIHAAFINSNGFGCYLVMAMVFISSFIFTKTCRFKVRIILSALFILLSVCLVLTVSRGAWMAFLFSMLFMSIWIRALMVILLVIGIVLGITKNLYFPFLKDRLNNFFAFFNNSYIGADRRAIWPAAWRMFLSSPWTGVGIGTFMFNFRKFVAGNYIHGSPYAHNCYLQMAAEIGIIGLVPFLIALALYFYNGIKCLNTHKRNFFWYIVLASNAAVLGYSAQMAVDTTFYCLDLGVLFWLVLGLGSGAMKNIKAG